MKAKIKCEWTFKDERGEYLPDDADFEMFVVTIDDVPVYFKRFPKLTYYEPDTEMHRQHETLAEFAQALRRRLETWL